LSSTAAGGTNLCKGGAITDAVCSSSDETHDGLLALYEKRYSEQVEAVTSDIIKANWLDA
jgi:hypothetical protein